MSTTQILKTKLYSPAPRRRMVARPRLVERLNAGLQPGQQLILISAPAGFGKTTLASEWISGGQLERSVAWISLDEGENDPTRFLLYLTAALQQVDARIGAAVTPLLETSQSLPLTELVTQIINQIAASGLPVLLVLDDYHLINCEAVHQMVQLLIDRQPSQMHTVLLTREDPPFPLPRMRARGQVTQIRERDLYFTLPEARAFLLEAMELDLTGEDVEKLKERTEGWAAGMQLAALALEDYADEQERRAFIDAFAGSDRFIVDYLISEVLQRQSQTTRQFLLYSSILERFCADLCDQVVFQGNSPGQSQHLLEALEQGNMFLVPLDNQRQWYRYHHLFGEMLRHSLVRSAPDQTSTLHRQASAWFEEKGFIPEAVRHAQLAADWDLTRELLGRHAMHMLFQGQGSLVLGWCHALPRTSLAQAPELCIFYAWALVLTFRTDYLDAVEDKLRLAERALAAPGLPDQIQIGPGGPQVPLRDWVTGQICAVRSQILLGHFNTYVDPEELIALSLKGLEQLPEVEKAIRSLCIINLAHAQLMQNHPAQAGAAFENALPFMLEAGNYLGSVTAIFYLARLAYYQGHPEQAEALCQQWKVKFLEMSGRSEVEIPALRGLDIVLSLLGMEQNQFVEAEQTLVRSLELLGWASWMDLYGFIMLARLRHQRGDIPGVNEVLDRMGNLGPQHASCAEALRHLFAVKSALADPRQRNQAEAWADAHAPDLSAPQIPLGIGPYHCDTEYFCSLTWAQVQTALGRPREALTFIEPALAAAAQAGLPLRKVELSVTLALARDALGDAGAAGDALAAALETGAPHDYVRVFDEGPALDRLLVAAARKGVHPQYVQRLLGSFVRQAAVPETAAQPAAGLGSNGGSPAPWLEPLSERETEVLALISAGFSNNQIAEKLFISQGTVKRHITNLYGKLEVESRTQAVARGRELGLIG